MMRLLIISWLFLSHQTERERLSEVQNVSSWLWRFYMTSTCERLSLDLNLQRLIFTLLKIWEIWGNLFWRSFNDSLRVFREISSNIGIVPIQVLDRLVFAVFFLDSKRPEFSFWIRLDEIGNRKAGYVRSKSDSMFCCWKFYWNLRGQFTFCSAIRHSFKSTPCIDDQWSRNWLLL